MESMPIIGVQETQADVLQAERMSYTEEASVIHNALKLVFIADIAYWMNFDVFVRHLMYYMVCVVCFLFSCFFYSFYLYFVLMFFIVYIFWNSLGSILPPHS